MLQTLREDQPLPDRIFRSRSGPGAFGRGCSAGSLPVERHITLDRAMWVQIRASVEPQGLASLVKYIRVTERSLAIMRAFTMSCLR